MKFVRTARGYKGLNHGDVTVTGQPLEVSEDAAAELVKVGESAGVAVLVFDTREEALEDAPTASKLGVATPDLAAGRGAVFGTGDPVQSPGVTPEGDEPEQATEGDEPAVEFDPYDGLLKADLEKTVAERVDAGRTITVQGNGTVADLKAALVADDNNKEL